MSPRERNEFVDFVAHSIEDSKPQRFRTPAGFYKDWRRSVSRFVISPESAAGLDLERLTSTAVKELEIEVGADDLRWVAAIHRNTAHHHVHLVLAGMRSSGLGGFMRFEISKPRLEAMKGALGLEIERQRAERSPSRNAAERLRQVAVAQLSTPATHQVEANRAPEQVQVPTRRSNDDRGPSLVPLHHNASVIALRAVARRYQRQMERELEDAHRQGQRELAE